MDPYVVKALNAQTVTVKTDNVQVALHFIMLTTVFVFLIVFLTVKFKQLRANVNHAITV